MSEATLFAELHEAEQSGPPPPEDVPWPTFQMPPPSSSIPPPPMWLPSQMPPPPPPMWLPPKYPFERIDMWDEDVDVSEPLFPPAMDSQGRIHYTFTPY